MCRDVAEEGALPSEVLSTFVTLKVSYFPRVCQRMFGEAGLVGEQLLTLIALESLMPVFQHMTEKKTFLTIRVFTILTGKYSLSRAIVRFSVEGTITYRRLLVHLDLRCLGGREMILGRPFPDTGESFTFGLFLLSRVLQHVVPEVAPPKELSLA